MSFELSACLLCRHARRADMGQAKCILDGEIYSVHHVCFSFDSLSGSFHDAGTKPRFEVAVSSTTATNSHQWEKSNLFTPATNSPSEEFLTVFCSFSTPATDFGKPEFEGAIE